MDLFHNIEIIHYLVEQNGGFDRAMKFLVLQFGAKQEM